MTTLGRYTIVRKLATGGMAEVFLAKVAGPGGFEKHVVLKKILPQLADNELYVKMFLDEARLAAQLDHPNIVHVFDFGEADGAYFLTMEYVEGANLRHLVRWAFRADQPIAPTLVARIVAQACEALAYAHEFVPPDSDEVTRLVHRDVSPENIMLARTGAVKLLDFGVAKDTTEDHRSKVGSLKGKVAYMPPEQIRGEQIDHRVDIYALGVVLYQALSGKRPYGQATDVALISGILNDEPTPLLRHRLDLPDNLLDIVSKAMSKRPDARFQTCTELRDALEQYIAHEGQPAGTAQIAQLVLRYQAENLQGSSRTGLASGGGGSGSNSGKDSSGEGSRADGSKGDGSKLESSHSGLSRGAGSLVPAPPVRESGPLNQLFAQVAQTTPGRPGPFMAQPAPMPPEPDTGPALPAISDPLAGVVPKLTPSLPVSPNPSEVTQPAAARPQIVPAEGPPQRPSRPLPMLSPSPVEAPQRPVLPTLTPAPAESGPPQRPSRPLPDLQQAQGGPPQRPSRPLPDLLQAQGGPPRRPSQAALPVAQGVMPPPAASAPRPGDDSHQTRRWAPTPVAAEPIRQALREGLRSDRSVYLLRKLPAVIGRLCDFSKQLPWSVIEAFSGVIDAAVLSDDHATITRMLERAAQKPGRDQRFATLVLTELRSPLRLAWLIERLRSGLPVDAGALRGWLFKLGETAAPLLLQAIELSDLGPAQDLFAEALAHCMPEDARFVLDSVTQAKLQSVAALCFVLERAQVTERAKAFQMLIGRREPALQVEVLTGRARARGNDSSLLLESALGDRAEEVRHRALELLGELGGAKAYGLLQRAMSDPTFEQKTTAERGRFWAAALACGGEEAKAQLDQVLTQKPSLLNKRKVLDAKLPVIEGLARAKTEAAQTLLERVAQDRGQGDEVQAAARTALSGAPPAPDPFEQKPVGERRTRLGARITLDLVMLARASTAVDVGSGLLDGAIEQFRNGLRQITNQEGKVQFVLTDIGPTINGMPVSFGPFHEAVAPLVHTALKVRDLKGFAIEAALPLAEFRSFLSRAFDPDGGQERIPHIKAINFAGAGLMPLFDAASPSDATLRTRELFALVVRWLHAQREGLKAGRPVDVAAIGPVLDEWARLVSEGHVRFLGVAHWTPSDTGTLVHAANTAGLCMAFTHDLGLSRSAVREAGELAVTLGLAEACVSADRRAAAGEAPHEEERFHAAGLALTYRINRLGTAVAIGAIESGLPHEGTSRGAGVLASVHALAKAYDALTAGNNVSPGQALEALNQRLRWRFSPELLGLFTQWAFAQAAAGTA